MNKSLYKCQGREIGRYGGLEKCYLQLCVWENKHNFRRILSDPGFVCVNKHDFRGILFEASMYWKINVKHFHKACHTGFPKLVSLKAKAGKTLFRPVKLSNPSV